MASLVTCVYLHLVFWQKDIKISFEEFIEIQWSVCLQSLSNGSNVQLALNPNVNVRGKGDIVMRQPCVMSTARREGIVWRGESACVRASE